MEKIAGSAVCHLVSAIDGGGEPASGPWVHLAPDGWIEGARDMRMPPWDHPPSSIRDKLYPVKIHGSKQACQGACVSEIMDAGSCCLNEPHQGWGDADGRANNFATCKEAIAQWMDIDGVPTKLMASEICEGSNSAYPGVYGPAEYDYGQISLPEGGTTEGVVDAEAGYHAGTFTPMRGYSWDENMGYHCDKGRPQLSPTLPAIPADRSGIFQWGPQHVGVCGGRGHFHCKQVPDKQVGTQTYRDQNGIERRYGKVIECEGGGKWAGCQDPFKQYWVWDPRNGYRLPWVHGCTGENGYRCGGLIYYGDPHHVTSTEVSTGKPLDPNPYASCQPPSETAYSNDCIWGWGVASAPGEGWWSYKEGERAAWACRTECLDTPGSEYCCADGGPCTDHGIFERGGVGWGDPPGDS